MKKIICRSVYGEKITRKHSSGHCTGAKNRENNDTTDTGACEFSQISVFFLFF